MSLKAALWTVITLEIARLPVLVIEAARLAIITLEIAWWPVVTVKIALSTIIALEAARRAVIAARIVAARWWPRIGIARIFAGAEIAAFWSGLVVPALLILALVKFAHTRLEGAWA